MDIQQMLLELRERREQVVDSIVALERLELNGRKRRGRPPKWIVEPKAAVQRRPRVAENTAVSNCSAEKGWSRKVPESRTTASAVAV
jgi:hypothetical protein